MPRKPEKFEVFEKRWQDLLAAHLESPCVFGAFMCTDRKHLGCNKSWCITTTTNLFLSFYVYCCNQTIIEHRSKASKKRSIFWQPFTPREFVSSIRTCVICTSPKMPHEKSAVCSRQLQILQAITQNPTIMTVIENCKKIPRQRFMIIIIENSVNLSYLGWRRTMPAFLHLQLLPREGQHRTPGRSRGRVRYVRSPSRLHPGPQHDVGQPVQGAQETQDHGDSPTHAG